MNRFLSVLFTLLFTVSLQAQVLYVKADATGANNGTTWTNAYTDLQNAIATASYGTQIWVAEGIYTPTSNTDRSIYFELKNGVEIYGGFLGSEIQLAERDYIHNETILSGDLGVVGDSLDNSYTVVYSAGTDENTILEGFTIQAGNANYTGNDVLDTHPSKSGGGMYLTGEMSDLRCQIKHCHFKNNHSDARGGGLFIWSGPGSGSTRPNIFANEFTQNNAGTLGGGFYWIGGTFLQDELIPADSLIFNNNHANVGGGIHMTSRVNSAVAKIRNCTFNENTSGTVGGGFYFREDSFESLGLEFEGCNFTYNNSSSIGGGIFYGGFAEFKNVTLRDCYLDHNLAGTIENRLDGGGIYLEGYIDTPDLNAKLLLENTTMSWNRGNYGGAINANIEGPLSIEVKNSIFQYNSASFSGGGVYSTKVDHIMQVSNSYFEGNTANDATGGGIHVQTSDVEITNCIFNANIGKTGAGIRMINGNVTNCIFYENNALQQGGGIRCNQAVISNCIFWNNINFGTGPDIYNNSFPITLESCLFSAADCEAVNYTNSNINCGANSIFGIDPLFTNPSIGDFTTSPNSVVRDAGNSAAFPLGITEDYYGNPRIQGSNIDLGVYEIPIVSIASLTTGMGDCQETSLNNGTLNYDIINGVTPLNLSIGEIEIITSDITGTIEGLAGGTYDFTVTDAAGNSVTQSVSIPFLPQPNIAAEVTSPTCNGFTNGVIVLSASGETAPFTILWDNGSDNFGQYGIAGGDHAYTITDAFACQLIGIGNIPQPDPIVINGTTQDTSCDGEDTGQITINPTGGTGNLTAVWSPNPNNESGYQLTNIPAGTYSVTVSDESGCAFSSQYTISGAEDIEISAVVTDAGCTGGASGEITVTPVTGTGSFTYVWSNSQTGATISDLSADDYTVTATDGNGCSVIETYTVSAAVPLTFSPILTQITCAGETDGSINLNIDNPEGLNFMWSPNVNGQTGVFLTELAADTYFLTVTDENDCPSFAEYILTEPLELSLSPAISHPSCLGASDGIINLSTQGGTGEYEYQILPSVAESNDGIFEGLSEGTYQLIVTDENLCALSETVILEDGAPLAVNGLVTNVSCFNGNTGAITIDDTAGSSYLWSANADGQIGNNVSNLVADTYAVTVTNELGCEGTAEFVVGEPSEILVNSTIQNATCQGSTNGSVTFEIAGGTPPYTITGETEDLGAGMYLATITDANACTQEVSFEIMENEGLELTLVVTDASCHSSDNGSVEVLITGGMPPYTIAGETTDLTAGDYTISVTDANACGATADFTVQQPSPLNFDFDIMNAETQTSQDGSINIENVTGGTPPYIFNWENGEMTEDLTNISAGMYNLLVTDANDCNYSFGFEVDFNTGVSDLSNLGWKVELRPNILSTAQNTILVLETDRTTLGRVQIYDAVGRLFVNESFDISTGKSEYELETTGLSAGVYFVRLETAFGGEILRMMVAK